MAHQVNGKRERARQRARVSHRLTHNNNNNNKNNKNKKNCQTFFFNFVLCLVRYRYIGKKSVSYFVFIKCNDGGFEAHSLEDWYSFAPHRTYKTLGIDEAEEEFKKRHKTLNKTLIIVSKRRNAHNDETTTRRPSERLTGPA